MEPIDKITEARQIVRDLGLNTDRDLIEQLGIKDNEDLRTKLHAWIRYQGAFEYVAGYKNGQDNIRHEIKTILNIHG